MSSKARFPLHIAATCTLLAACAHAPEPKIVTKLVQVPVTVPCVPASFPQSPAFPDTPEAIRASPGAGDLLQLLAAGRILRIQRLSEVEAVLNACR